MSNITVLDQMGNAVTFSTIQKLGLSTSYLFGKVEPEKLVWEILEFCFQNGGNWPPIPENTAEEFYHSEWLKNFTHAGLLDHKEGKYHITNTLVELIYAHAGKDRATNFWIYSSGGRFSEVLKTFYENQTFTTSKFYIHDVCHENYD